MGQYQVPDLIVVEEGARNHVVNVDEFARKPLLTRETEAVLIATRDWTCAGDVSAGVPTRA